MRPTLRHLTGVLLTAVLLPAVGAGPLLITASPAQAQAAPGPVVGSAPVPGTSATTSRRPRVLPRPVLNQLVPYAGSVSGGTVVTLTGTYLAGTTSVTFDAVPAQVLTVAADRVTVIAPPRRDRGPSTVIASGPGGDSLSTPTNLFLYVDPPVVTAITPAGGRTDEDTVVTITGRHLDDALTVLFGDRSGRDLVKVSPTELQVTAPRSGTVRDVDLRVSGVAGNSAVTAATTFHYSAAPVLTTSGPHRGWLPLGLIGILSWSVWFVRRFLSRHRYSPVVNDFTTTTSVIVPVYREDADVLERCLRTWVREDPTEIVLVVDDRDAHLLQRLAELPFPQVKVVEWRHTGKRGALGAGIREATGEIVVFADSDTEWRPGLLANIVMPFVDPGVGGVGSRQHVYLPETNIWRRVAYWMLNSRYLDYVPAMSRRGGVACLSGRTAAYRRHVVRPLAPALEHEVFLGRECVAGDDGRLTWLVLAAGYKTVHQDTAQADSMFPGELRAFLKQRIRWSRNSYRCYLTAVSQGWLWHQPFITQVTVLQILLTPVSMGATIWYSARYVDHVGLSALAVVLVWAVLARALRAASHLMENPREIVLAPLVALMVIWIALPVKTWAALTMNKQGWLTRVEGDRVQGQGEIEVGAHARVS